MREQLVIQVVGWQDVLPVREAVMYPGKNPELAKVNGDETALHLGLFVADKLVTVISLFTDEAELNTLQFRKFATIEAEQGKGYGTTMLQHVLQYAHQQRYNRIWCHARTTALNVYKKFGFQELGNPFIRNGISYINMSKNI